MKTWKTFLTMEFTADVEANTEEEARDRLFFHIFNGFNDVRVSDIDNIDVKKWWGGANEVKAVQDETDTADR